MQRFPVKSLFHKVLGGGGVYAYIRYAWTHDFVLAGMAVFVGDSTTLEKKSGMVLVFEALTTLWIARWRFGHSVLVRYDAQAHHFVYHHDYRRHA
jgi:hypothetical protein